MLTVHEFRSASAAKTSDLGVCVRAPNRRLPPRSVAVDNRSKTTQQVSSAESFYAQGFASPVDSVKGWSGPTLSIGRVGRRGSCVRIA